jgi:hypothetical protein
MNLADSITLALLIGLVLIFSDIAAGGDTWQIKQENEVSHRWGARLRGVALSLPAVAFYVPRMQGVELTTLAGALALATLVFNMLLLWVLLLVVFWIAFDLRINKRWGKDWYYIGATASLDNLSNKLLAKFKYPGKAYVYFKIAAFFVLLAVIVLVNAKAKPL